MLPQSIFSGHYSRFFYCKDPLEGPLTDDPSATKTAFEANSPTELKGVRAAPELSEQAEVQNFPIFGSAYTLSMPGQRSLQPATITCNYYADDHDLLSDLTLVYKNRQLTILCVGLTNQRINNYSDLATAQAARYYSWGRFIDRSILPNLTDVVQVRLTFLPMSPWLGPL